MVNLQAAVQYLPSITNYEMGLNDLDDGGGLFLHPNCEELTQALITATNWSNGDRVERGKQSHDMVNEKYTWKVLIPKWYDFYGSYLSRISA